MLINYDASVHFKTLSIQIAFQWVWFHFTVWMRPQVSSLCRFNEQLSGVNELRLQPSPLCLRDGGWRGRRSWWITFCLEELGECGAGGGWRGRGEGVRAPFLWGCPTASWQARTGQNTGRGKWRRTQWISHNDHAKKKKEKSGGKMWG